MLALMALPVFAAQAQAENVVITQLPSAPRQMLLQGEEPHTRAIIHTDDACKLSAIQRDSEASALGCAFEDATLGFALTDELEIPSATFKVTSSFARGTSGAFALDHIMRGYRRGMNAETTLATVGLGTKLLDDRFEWSSKLSWSRNWDVPVAPAPFAPFRLNEETGSASEHNFKARLIDRRDLKWSLEGQWQTASEGYKPYHASVPDRLFAIEGDRSMLKTSLDIGKWRLRASRQTTDNRFLSSESNKLSIGRGGITFDAKRRVSETNPAVVGGSTQSRQWRNDYAVTFDTFTLLPLVAIEDTGLASLVPKMLTLEASDAQIERHRAAGLQTLNRRSIGGFALWTTPLGDTILNLRSERETGEGAGFASQSGTDTFFMVSHSFGLGDWSIDLDYVANSNSTSRAAILSDGSDFGSYGISARYAAKGRPRIELSLGRDSFDILAAEGDLRLRDRSLRAQAEVDFTPWLQSKLERDDMRLNLQMQWDFDDSAYEFTLFDEVIDSEFTRSQARGFLINFSMDLP